MTIPALISKDGQKISLGALLGRGGEASVYEVASSTNAVAKIYHRPADLSTAQKLALMCSIGTDRLKKLTAWPIATLHDPSMRQTLGVLMPNVSGYKDIHRLYTPKSRFRDFPSANWPFLVHTAANTARAFAAIHEQGIVVGDVNESNVRVAPSTATVTLIDCDSFQVSNGTKRYLCEVGTPTYTPPELQGMTFANVVRTTNHDNFGLSVMIFHLLFMGRHPFAGRFLGNGEMPIERAIGEFRFAFSRSALTRQMQPPPGSLTLGDLSKKLGDCFESSFSPLGAQSGRPSAKQWVDKLADFESKLRSCSLNSAHFYFKDLSQCPWCRIEKSGIVFFVSVASAPGMSCFNIDRTWVTICAIPSPGPAPSLPPVASPARAVPSPAAHAAGKYKRMRWGSAVFLLCAGFGLCFWVGSIAPLIIAAVVAFILINAKRGQAPFVATLRSAEAKVAAVQMRWNEQAGDAQFQRKRTELEKLRNEYLALPQLRLKRYQELERNKYAAQLRRYLEQFSLEKASIPKIGPGRKAILRSFGIVDADDLIKLQTQSVPGIGPNYTVRLLSWRQTLVSRFAFNATQAIDSTDVQRLDADIGNRRAEVERLLLQGTVELNRSRAQVQVSREGVRRDYEIASQELLQAQTDLAAV